MKRMRGRIIGNHVRNGEWLGQGFNNYLLGAHVERKREIPRSQILAIPQLVRQDLHDLMKPLNSFKVMLSLL